MRGRTSPSSGGAEQRTDDGKAQTCPSHARWRVVVVNGPRHQASQRPRVRTGTPEAKRAAFAAACRRAITASRDELHDRKCHEDQGDQYGGRWGGGRQDEKRDATGEASCRREEANFGKPAYGASCMERPSYAPGRRTISSGGTTFRGRSPACPSSRLPKLRPPDTKDCASRPERA